MRFVVGLVCGALLVLWVAPLPSPSLDRASVGHLLAGLQALWTSAAANGAEPSRAPAETAARPEADGDRERAIEPALEPIPHPPDVPEQTRLAAAVAATPGAAQPEPPAAPLSPDGAPLALEAADRPATDDARDAQPVWVPFHSRISASGFAGRLSESLSHPFRVERQGPGRYQVVFAYRDAAERRTLLDQAAAVTGLSL